MRIVLLGATGFVGHNLLPALSEAGHQCLTLSRYRLGCRELALIPGVELIQGDIFEPEFLRAHLQDADVVVNLVGILNERGAKGKGFHRAHVELVEKLIAACADSKVKRLLHMSALNAGKGDSHYLISKGKAEDLIRNAPHLDSTIFQPSVIFGDGDAFFNRFASLLRLTPVFPLACPGAKMQPVWVGDVAQAMAAALERPETIGQTMVLVGPEQYSLKELVELTARHAGLKTRVVGLPDSLSRLQGLLMDFVPGKPFSSDNYRSLQTDNVSTENALPFFGIRPRAVEGVIESYLEGSIHQEQLDRCRKWWADR